MKMTKSEKLKVKELAKKYELTESQVIEIIRSPYEFITKTLKELDVPRDWTEEEFNKNIASFNIPAICKLYGSYNVYKRLNKL